MWKLIKRWATGWCREGQEPPYKTYKFLLDGRRVQVDISIRMYDGHHYSEGKIYDYLLAATLEAEKILLENLPPP